ncbi:uncharacterized protein M6B38_354795 [Iris pallida]|uniref:Polysaccharide biosynthesis domain-containing protein n=1 Tax=Iris pallida TaxID=29817 RepID=A0AAX6GNY0_IRIPA|nr:uncharacterized protein M6B38_354795 [Iris pallida]
MKTNTINNTNNNTKLILFHPTTNPLCKQQSGSFSSLLASGSGSHHHRLLVVAVVSFFTFASLFTFLTTTTTTTTTTTSSTSPSISLSLSTPSYTITTTPPVLADALLHYAAAASSTGNGRMPEPELRAISQAIRRRAPCNLLVFGLTPETLLWRSLNHGGRTVFLDENEYYVAHYESKHPNALEAYDVSYTTKVAELENLIQSSRERVGDECRPVQNLLFSDCRLAINDMPNQLYDVSWDVILVDGPSGYAPTAPGRMSAIFTAAVMARTTGKGRTDVLVHDYEREVEKVCSEEFLCGENLVSVNGQLAHYIIRGGSGGGGDRTMDGFCKDRNSTLPSAGETMTEGTV